MFLDFALLWFIRNNFESLHEHKSLYNSNKLLFYFLHVEFKKTYVKLLLFSINYLSYIVDS